MSSSLLERCKTGDEGAWREVVSQRARQVYRWAVLLGLHTVEAEDAAQEVLLTAARRIDSCEDEAAMTSWLYQITRRIVANHRRRGWLRRWRVGSQAMDENAFVHATSTDRVYEIEARRCLQELRREQAEVLVMIEIVGLTQEECARILGVPAGTVASRLRRARRAFVKRWNEEDAKNADGEERSKGEQPAEP
jgi:RNA polymerase sigma-70 factor (ECF subfamily)